MQTHYAPRLKQSELLAHQTQGYAHITYGARTYTTGRPREWRGTRMSPTTQTAQHGLTDSAYPLPITLTPPAHEVRFAGTDRASIVRGAVGRVGY